ADLVVVFHVPLFTRWLKDVMDGGTRVLMIIDAPDDLEQLMAPRGLKEACKHAESLYKKTKSVRVGSKAGTDLTYQCGEYPVMTQWGYADERAHFDHWGGGHIHTFPNEGSAHGTVVLQPGDIVILPYCRYVADPVKLEIREGHIVKVEGAMDAKLMRDWLEDGKSSPADRDPYAVSHLGWGMNPQALWYGIALYGDTPERHRAAARTFPGTFLFSTGPNTPGGGKRHTRGHYGVPMRDCTVELKLKDGKLGGLPAEVLIGNDQLKPENAKQLVERYLRLDKVDFITGTVFSNIVVAIAPDVIAARTFFIAPNAGPAAYSGAQCNPFFFVSSWPSEAYSEAAGEYMNRKGIQNVLFVAPNYVGGKDAATGFKRYYQGRLVEEMYTKLGQLDYAAELSQIRAARPQALYVFLPGGMGVNFLKQFVAAGLSQ